MVESVSVPVAALSFFVQGCGLLCRFWQHQDLRASPPAQALVRMRITERQPTACMLQLNGCLQMQC
jgi:hypothetical protein